ncbi:hypothetical protein SUGI_1060560 [Cryptomeria japonica]|nr:hypothetical protein SUGI_1060560 [Cryptomeria japonica]
MNVYCGARESSRWRSGWPLPSGELTSLCNICGTLYEKGNFCKAFHTSEDGWEECKFCNIPIHSGCIASGSSVHNGGHRCRNCAFMNNDVHQQNTSKMTVCTQISDKSNDSDGEPVEETDSDSDKNLPHIYMIDGFQIKAYKRPPVVTTISMRKKDDEGDEGDDNEVMVQSDPPATTKHGRHRDGCRCVVCTQHPKGNPHPQNCECRGCAIYLKRRETTLRRSKKKSPAAASTSKRGRHKSKD